MPLRRFQASVGTSLTSAGRGKIKCGRPLSSPEAGGTPPPRKRPTSRVPSDVRQDGIDHFPVLYICWLLACATVCVREVGLGRIGMGIASVDWGSICKDEEEADPKNELPSIHFLYLLLPYRATGEMVPVSGNLRGFSQKVVQVGADGVRRVDWHDYETIRRDAARIGNGEQGKPFPLTETDRVDQAYRENGFNIYVSNRISLNRSLPDIRHENCKQTLYAEKLPNTSIIIPFHNEGWSSLLRTVHSVINRSPPELIAEIILVDDFSDKG
ncbi:hypothetical protein ATANTOWER_024515 [Ataeniobius toweri]|uniref:Glycosyltransferase 2-like domain-containing protein n=1 Tax=Ataeniobius toweri TaxID=208326 RepID=A0ABU7AK34_9TELE|nr:hypothetical protein [Ataeniobius toweri]